MKNKTIRLLSAVLLLAITLSFAACDGESEDADGVWWYDFMSADLSPYLTVKPEDYTGLVLTVTPKTAVDDAYVYDYFWQQDGVEDVLESFTDVPAAAGDRLVFYYRVSLNGEDLQHLTNYPSDDGAVFVLGRQNGFLVTSAEKAFNDAVLAAQPIPENYSLVRRKDGTVGAGATVFATVEGAYPDAESGADVPYDSDTYCRLTLGDENGIYHYLYADTMRSTDGKTFAELTVGETAVFERYDASVGAVVTYAVTPHFVVDEEKTLDVDVPFPEGYDEGGELAYLGGQTATFHICPRYIDRIDDEFFPLLVSYLEGQAEATYEDGITDAIVSALRNRYFISAAPEEALEAARHEVQVYFRLSYEEYVASYGDTRFSTMDSYLDALFAQNYMTREEGLNYYAASAVSEYITYYAVAQKMGLALTEEKIDAAYTEYLASVGDEKAQADFIAAYDTYYGEGYLRYYVSYCMLKSDVVKAIRDLAIIQNKTN